MRYVRVILVVMLIAVAAILAAAEGDYLGREVASIMPGGWIFQLITQLGTPVALVVYFLWRDERRDKVIQSDKRTQVEENERRELALAARITELEKQLKEQSDDHRSEIVSMVRAQTENIIVQDRRARQMIRSMDKLTEFLVNNALRPCPGLKGGPDDYHPQQSRSNLRVPSEFTEGSGHPVDDDSSRRYTRARSERPLG